MGESNATLQALTLMAIALPTMFAVIAVFIGATVALKNAFPATDDEE